MQGIRLYFATFFRFKWLILLYLTLLPVGMLLTLKLDPIYTVESSFWVDQSPYIDSSQTLSFNIVQSAVENHQILLQSLLYSKTFQESFIKELKTKGYNFSPDEESRLLLNLWSSFKFKTYGQNLLQVQYNGKYPEYSLDMVRTLEKVYDDFISALMKDRGNSIVEYINNQLQDLDQQLDKLNHQVDEMVANNPNIGANILDPNAPFTTLDDLNFSNLIQNKNSVSQKNDQLKTELDTFLINYQAFLDGKYKYIDVIDQPVIINRLIYNNTTHLILCITFGLIGGVMLAVVLIMLLTWFDIPLRDLEYTRQYLGVAVVAEVPLLSGAGFQRRRKFTEFNKIINQQVAILSAICIGLAGMAVFFSMRDLPNAIIVPLILLLACLIYQWPEIGLVLATLIVTVCELYSTPDGFSQFTIIPIININFFTNLPLSASWLELIIAGSFLATTIKTWQRGEKFLFRSPTTLVILAFAGFLVWGFLWGGFIRNGDKKTGLWEVRALIYVVVIYLLTSYLAVGKQLWKVLEWCMVFGLTILSIFGIARMFLIDESTRNNSLYSESINGFNHDDAILFVILIMWCLIKITFGADNRVKMLAFVLILPAFGATMVSGRRGAFACMAICLIALMAILYKRNRKAFIIAAIILAVTVPPYITIFKNVDGPLGLPARAFSSSTGANQVGSRDYSSDLYRVVERTNVQMTIKDSPITGIGFGQPFTVYIPMVAIDFFVFQNYTPHVQVLWLWLKVGMLGWIVFWLAICSSLFKLGQLAKFDKTGQRLSMAILMGCFIISIMTYAYIDIVLANVRMMFLLGLSIGILERIYYDWREETVQAPPVALDVIREKQLVA